MGGGEYGAMRVLRLITAVGLVFLALCTYGCSCCQCEYENTGYRPSRSQFDRRMNELKDQEKALDDESEWLAQQEQALAVEWKAYKDLEAEFRSSLNREHLDALGELLTTDSPAQVEATSRISDVLSPEKSKELDAFLTRKSDLMARSAELQERREFHDLLVFQHESRVLAESSAMIQPPRPAVKKRIHTGRGYGGAMARKRAAAKRKGR